MRVIINEVLDLYRFEFIDDLTRCKVENHLNRKYPEVEWIVEIMDYRSGIAVTVTPKFRTPADETFYRLKWS